MRVYFFSKDELLYDLVVAYNNGETFTYDPKDIYARDNLIDWIKQSYLPNYKLYSIKMDLNDLRIHKIEMVVE